MLLGAQDVYFEKAGAFTGEISVDMLKDVGVRVCPDRPQRTPACAARTAPDLISKKAAAIYAGGLILIHCVGETLDQRDDGPHVCGGAKRRSKNCPPAIDDASPGW